MEMRREKRERMIKFIREIKTREGMVFMQKGKGVDKGERKESKMKYAEGKRQ